MVQIFLPPGYPETTGDFLKNKYFLAISGGHLEFLRKMQKLIISETV